METPVARRRRWPALAAALLAVGLLAAMALSGHVRESRQLVRFVPGGVMPEEPAEIDRVELRRGDARWVFVRGPGGWQAAPNDRAVPIALVTSLDESIKFMHVSAPIRVMERSEWDPVGLREFGLDPPGYAVILFRRDTPTLQAEFGAPNPQKVLQYMKLGGDDRIYLMSRFIGEAWESALREAAAR